MGAFFHQSHTCGSWSRTSPRLTRPLGPGNVKPTLRPAGRSHPPPAAGGTDAGAGAHETGEPGGRCLAAGAALASQELPLPHTGSTAPSLRCGSLQPTRRAAPRTWQRGRDLPVQPWRHHRVCCHLDTARGDRVSQEKATHVLAKLWVVSVLRILFGDKDIWAGQKG